MSSVPPRERERERRPRKIGFEPGRAVGEAEVPGPGWPMFEPLESGSRGRGCLV